MTIKCLLVDDEPLAHRVIERYAEDLPMLEIAGTCRNAFEAMEALNRHRIDLLFLDIQMPKLSGMDFLRGLTRTPLVIITTAYQEYALEGYELDIVDYLKKPFSFERFWQAVQKAQARLQPPAADSYLLDETRRQQIDEAFIFVKSDRKITYRVNLADILYVEALGDYVKIYTGEQEIITYQSLKGVADLLPANHFPRVHKSYIVALSKINAIDGNLILVDKARLPIGQSYRAEFMRLIHG